MRTIILTVFLSLSLMAMSQIVLPKVFSSNMVLQCEKPVNIWGKAQPGESVTVTFADQIKSVKTDRQGNWKIVLKPLKASAEPRKMTIFGSNTIILDNILVGEVWLCSGQSNMEYPLDRSIKKYAASNRSEDLATKVLNSPANPLIRYLYVERKIQAELPTIGWKDMNDSTKRNVSAAGYFFAQELADKLHVPIGIISSSWGGTRVEQWTPPTAYQNSPLFKDSIAGKNNFKIDGMVPGKQFEGMIKPLIPFTIKGIIWYQGESNLMIHDTATFIPKTKLMLNTWKNLWNDKDLSFHFVQIAPFYYSKRNDKKVHGTDLLAYYWEAQCKLMKELNTGMVVTTDLVDNLKDIHPGYKWEVGRRLALGALAKDYKQKIVYSGPVYKGIKIKKNIIELSFTHYGSGLSSTDGKELSWFTIAGADRKFVPAQAIIRGNKVIVSSAETQKPVAVRFAWDETAMPNFINKEGLPASPFRTDEW